MIKLICERELCKYCLYGQCHNEKIIEEFKGIKTVTEVLLSVSRSSCNEYDEDESLIDAYS